MTCAQDCGACAPRCGDGSCNGTESCSTCPGDCGTCTVSCSSLGNCASCVADTRCGWCATTGACAPGNANGPTNSGDCFFGLGEWVRTANACVARDAGPPMDVGTVNPTRSCTGVSDTEGLDSECGWVLAANYSCTPNTSVTLGCTVGAEAGTCGASVGTCNGDPMIRVCPGSTPCMMAGRIPSSSTTGYNEDDACGRCPLVRVVCPSSGSMSVYRRSYTVGSASTCTVGRL